MRQIHPIVVQKRLFSNKPFENLLGDIPDEPLEAAAAAVNAMHQKLIEMFSSGDE